MLARIQNEQQYADRRKEERRRSQVQQGGMPPPSPALVRHGSKHGAKVPTGLTPGQLIAPHSAQAQVHIPIGNNQRTSTAAHPFAAAGIGAGYEYAQQHEQFKNPSQTQPYGRQSPMVSTVGAAPAALTNVRAMGNAGGIGQDYQQEQETNPKPTFIRMLTCRC